MSIKGRELIKNILKKLNIYGFLAKIVNERRDKKRSEAFHKNGQECLRRVKEAFDSIDRLFWLDYGTLLGAVREKDFIEHDLDLDIGTFQEGDILKLEEALRARGLEKVKEFMNQGKVVEQTYSYQGADIDIFFYVQEEDKMWCYSFYSEIPILPKEIDYGYEYEGWKAIRSITTYTGFDKIEFKGLDFDAPKDLNLYLTENYGANYMIKQKDWDSSSSPRNIEKVDIGEVTQYWYKY